MRRAAERASSLARQLSVRPDRPPLLDTRHLRRVVRARGSCEPPRGVILGAPGSGKSTYSKQLVGAMGGMRIIGMGDLLREAASKRGRWWSLGGLAPDEDVIQLLFARLAQPDVRSRGFLLDGFPRSVEQALTLDERAPLDFVLSINVPDEHVISKLLGRRACEACGRGYNLAAVNDVDRGVFMPAWLPPGYDTPGGAEEPLRCECGHPLSVRPDDTADVIANRLAVYHERTEPLIAHYRRRGLLAEYNVRLGWGDLATLAAQLRDALATRTAEER